MGPAVECSDEEIDPFDALMDIEAEEFSRLLRDAPTDAEVAKSPAGPRLRRGGVPVLSVDEVTPESFRRDFLVPRRPVVLVDPRRGAATGHANLTPDKLRDAFGDAVVPLDVTDRRERAEVRLGDFLDAVQEKDAAKAAGSERDAPSSSSSSTKAAVASRETTNESTVLKKPPTLRSASRMSPPALRRKGVQQAFVDAGAAQCGYCIPGFVVAVTGMLEIDPKPNAEAIQEALSFHLCRCGSHGRIKAAIDSLVGSAGSS